jgi:hypothetical protein
MRSIPLCFVYIVIYSVIPVCVFAQAEIARTGLKNSPSQAWADELASSGCMMKHRPHSGKWEQEYGENIYWCSGLTAKIRNRWAWGLSVANCQLPVAS